MELLVKCGSFVKKKSPFLHYFEFCLKAKVQQMKKPYVTQKFHPLCTQVKAAKHPDLLP